MLLLIVLILVILWAVGDFAVHIGGDLIHLLLLVALVVLIYDLFVRYRGRGTY